MGFTSGLSVYPKFNKKEHFNSDKMSSIGHILSYEKNSWAKEHFKTAEEYALTYCNVLPTKEEVIFYSNHAKLDEYKVLNIYKDYGIWYSNGIEMHEWMRHNFESVEKDYFVVELGKNDVLKILRHSWEKINECMPQSCYLINSYTYFKEDEDSDDYSIKLSRTDGIEVEFEDGMIKRIDGGEDLEFLMPRCPGTYSIDIYPYANFIDACIKILEDVDFENQYVIYSGGW